MTLPNHLEDLMQLLGEDDDIDPVIFEDDDAPKQKPPATKPMTKPVISQAVEEAALDALAQFQDRETWNKWGMSTLREKGIGILLEGEPGTGKTTIAAWMAHKIKKGFLKLSGAEVGGGNPGESERKVHEFFENARRRKNATIFIDECDHMLMDRESISSEGTTWQLGMIEALMVEMNTYPGLIIAATNHAKNLDPALADRFTIVHVPQPDLPLRIKLWRTKIPRAFPFQPLDHHLKDMAKAKLNGRTIENTIVAVANYCIRKGLKPNMNIFTMMIDRQLANHIPTK